MGSPPTSSITRAEAPHTTDNTVHSWEYAGMPGVPPHHKDTEGDLESHTWPSLCRTMLGYQASLDTAVPQVGAEHPGGNLCPEPQMPLESRAPDLVTSSTNPTTPSLSNPKSKWRDQGPTCPGLLSCHFSSQSPWPEGQDPRVLAVTLCHTLIPTRGRTPNNQPTM